MAPESSPCINSSQLFLNLFPAVLAVSHMFMHDSLTGFRQMLALITVNRSLRRSSWMRLEDQMAWVCLNTRFYWSSLCGRWLSRAGRIGSWVFSPVWIPAVLMRWSCLQPTQSVMNPCCHVCVVRIYVFWSTAQKASNVWIAHVGPYILRHDDFSLNCTGHWSWFSQGYVTHTNFPEL